MARGPRIDFPGSYHHVMNRGAARQSTYRNNWDRDLFLELVKRSVSSFGIEVIAFALMDNHYHLFLHSPDGQLSETMQFIGRAYTQEFNAHHGRDGALFRGRFHSVLVESEVYFGRLVRYVELNPSNGGVCSIDDLPSYKWSSFQYSAGISSPPDWLSTEQVHRFFGSPESYRSFATADIADYDLAKHYKRSSTPPSVIGSDAFIADVARRHPEFANHLPNPSESAESWEIEGALLEISGSHPDELFIPSSPTRPVRKAAIVLVHTLSKEPRNQLAKRYGFSSATAFIAAARRERQANSASEVRWLVNMVTARLSGIDRRV